MPSVGRVKPPPSEAQARAASAGVSITAGTYTCHVRPSSASGKTDELTVGAELGAGVGAVGLTVGKAEGLEVGLKVAPAAVGAIVLQAPPFTYEVWQQASWPSLKQEVDSGHPLNGLAVPFPHALLMHTKGYLVLAPGLPLS